MVCGADGSIRVWNVETGLATALLQGDTGQHLTCVDWAKDYLRIAQGTTTNGLQLIQIQFDSVLLLTFRFFSFSNPLKFTILYRKSLADSRRD